MDTKIYYYLKLAENNQLTTEKYYEYGGITYEEKGFGYNLGTPITHITTSGSFNVKDNYIIDNLIDNKYINKGVFIGDFDLRFSDHSVRRFDNYNFTLTDRGFKLINLLEEGFSLLESSKIIEDPNVKENIIQEQMLKEQEKQKILNGYNWIPIKSLRKKIIAFRLSEWYAFVWLIIFGLVFISLLNVFSSLIN
jgi:hypothetical protein